MNNNAHTLGFFDFYRIEHVFSIKCGPFSLNEEKFLWKYYRKAHEM